MTELPEHVIATSAELRECCDHIATCSVFGFDTEFIGEAYYRPRLCLVQVATQSRLFLIDPLAITDLTQFWELVADPARVTVVHAGREEIRMCAHQLGRPPANVFDVQVAAGLMGAGYPMSHGTLVQQFVKVRLSKGETLTDWSRRPLTRQQVKYAYDDVRYLIPLYGNISRRLSDLGRDGWANEEFTTLQDRSLDDDPEREPWRKLRGLGGLERNQLAVVREVFAWRDGRANTVNRPARFMLRDDLIVEIARRMPTSERELTVMRGVTKHDLAGLLAAVDRGRKMLPDDCPIPAERDNDPPQVALVAGFLIAALSSYCAEQHLTPSLVANGQEIKTIVRASMAGQPPPQNLALTRGWRAQHILPMLMDLLEGRRNVRIGLMDSAAPLKLSDPT